MRLAWVRLGVLTDHVLGVRPLAVSLGAGRGVGPLGGETAPTDNGTQPRDGIFHRRRICCAIGGRAACTRTGVVAAVGVGDAGAAATAGRRAPPGRRVAHLRSPFRPFHRAAAARAAADRGAAGGEGALQQPSPLKGGGGPGAGRDPKSEGPGRSRGAISAPKPPSIRGAGRFAGRAVCWARWERAAAGGDGDGDGDVAPARRPPPWLRGTQPRGSGAPADDGIAASAGGGGARHGPGSAAADRSSTKGPRRMGRTVTTQVPAFYRQRRLLLRSNRDAVLRPSTYPEKRKPLSRMSAAAVQMRARSVRTTGLGAQKAAGRVVARPASRAAVAGQRVNLPQGTDPAVRSMNA
eukprot:scaffold2752_cov393-Prasinococcus_capsulatus_cf.AAC.5